MIIQINPRHRVTTLGLLRLFFNCYNLPVLYFRNSKPFRVFHFRESQEAIAITLFKFINEPLDATDNHVIAKIEDELLLADKRFCQRDYL